MPIDILMPALSPTMTEGNLAKWLKKEGDEVKAGDVIAEIETDKATMEVEAIDEGILAKIVISEGSKEIPVNSVIAVLLEDGEDKSLLDNYEVDTPSITSSPVEEKSQEAPKKEVIAPAQNAKSGERIFASPLAKRIAAEKNIDLSQLTGSGPSGRIIKNDVLNFTPFQSNLGFGRDSVEYKSIPNSNIRRIIAKKLTESKQQIPHFYLSIECNMDKILDARKQLNDTANDQYKLSVNDFVIKASAMALRDVPEANASWTDTAILQYNNVDISVAVSIEGGLITPIIKNADFTNLVDISHKMKDLARRARENKLAPEEFQGGSFSISNLGMYGIEKFSAIINPPQSCILAIGSSVQKPIVKNGEIIIANMMSVTLSCDHRVVDGAVGANFLAAFKKYIENPILFIAR